jgi:hypothetical protein
MLNVKRNKIIQILIDMLELDSSEAVRNNSAKALIQLAPNDPKVILAFSNIDKKAKIYK